MRWFLCDARAPLASETVILICGSVVAYFRSIDCDLGRFWAETARRATLTLDCLPCGQRLISRARLLWSLAAPGLSEGGLIRLRRLCFKHGSSNRFKLRPADHS
jgi:hypothetical protein